MHACHKHLQTRNCIHLEHACPKGRLTRPDGRSLAPNDSAGPSECIHDEFHHRFCRVCALVLSLEVWGCLRLRSRTPTTDCVSEFLDIRTALLACVLWMFLLRACMLSEIDFGSCFYHIDVLACCLLLCIRPSDSGDCQPQLSGFALV